jgi:polyisoprenoid-binding protein YceI
MTVIYARRCTRNLFGLVVALLVLAGCSQDAAVENDDGGVLGIPSGVYAIDQSHTYVTFSYFHQGLSYPLLRATGIDGELVLDNTELAHSTVNVAVEVASIRTNLDYFDKELASRKFFHADKYPHISFATHSYRPVDDSSGEMTGFITIRDVTRPIVLSVVINGAMEHPMMKTPVIGISATGSLMRSDFGLDRFVPMVGNQVNINIEAEFLLGSSETSAAAAKVAADAVANADPASLQVSVASGAGQ